MVIISYTEYKNLYPLKLADDITLLNISRSIRVALG